MDIRDSGRVNFLFLLPFLLFVTSHIFPQIIPELQNAINSVPFATFAYPADRDRNYPPQVSSPQAYVFAYYNLPYAIDLGVNYDELTDSYLSKVIVKFTSVNLSSDDEKRMLNTAILQLQDMLDWQYAAARRAGFQARSHFTRSMISRFASNGQAIIAIREILITQALMDKLVSRKHSI